MPSAQTRSTVVGVFQDRAQADKAVSELLAAGFRQDQIGVAMRHADGEAVTSTGAADADEGHAGSGAIAGVLTGLGLGALAGLGVLAGVIPVVGPAIAAGTLGVILSNAAAGAGVAGLVGALVGAGMPEHEAEYYYGEFEAGRTIVTVTAAGKADEASLILRRNGAYDMEAGTPAGLDKTALRVSPASTKAKLGEADTIEVKEERLHAAKQPVKTGDVTVRKEVHTETKTIDVPVEREEIVIERTPVHGHVTDDGIMAEGTEQIRIPVMEEKVTVSKDAVVIEEVKVGKHVVHDTKTVSGEVRKEEVKVEQSGDVDVVTKDSAKTTRRV